MKSLVVTHRMAAACHKTEVGETQQPTLRRSKEVVRGRWVMVGDLVVVVPTGEEEGKTGQKGVRRVVMVGYGAWGLGGTCS